MLGRTIEKVEVDERFTRSGDRNVSLKLTFDNGYSLEFRMGDDDDTYRPMQVM